MFEFFKEIKKTKLLFKYLENNQMYISIGNTIEAYIKQNNEVRKLDVSITEGHIEIEDLLGIYYIGNVYEILDFQGVVKSLLVYNAYFEDIVFKLKGIRGCSLCSFILKEDSDG